MERRELLAGGLVGAVGLGGYHQRRRLWRWSDRDALRAALDLDPPDPRPRTALPVAESHVAAALDDLERRLTDAQRAWDDFDVEDDPRKRVEHAESRLEDAAAELEAADDRLDAFGTLSADERLALLDDLRTAFRGASEALALVRVDRGDRDREGIVDDFDALEDEYGAVADDLTYRATELSRAVAAYGELDERLEDVRLTIRAGRRSLESTGSTGQSNADATVSTDDMMLARASMRASDAAAELEDVERFADRLADEAGADADVVDDVLDARYETLNGEIEATVDDTDFEYDDDYAAYAWDVWERYDDPFRSDGSDERGEGRLALATRIAAERYAAALSLAAFADVPSTRFLDDDDPIVDESDIDGDDVREAKRRAVDELEARLDAEGDDPLVRYLCAELAADLESHDGRLERALEKINADDAGSWTIRLASLRLDYLVIAEQAAVLPTVLEAVNADR
ncbi:hypothetical protein [Halopiger xanaduensis]|uniref:Uncharacterized protein n=1 Tax=Halopiger xanaduensis (strain DSM 18323 / JCM 14033 / SH-6) TaxID=797210 RepID=F8DBL0_HALXS|nr:hypothetical protein [Halopiger xanaduensis]AEH38277.1 hypothetical protein Halxa_3669 [Halopiger xanaduensis SH-6]